MAARPDDARILSSGDGGAMERTGRILLVSKHLLLFTLATLAATVAVFGIGLWFDRFPMSWFCFECGIVGGFVSIQQRLKRVSDEELTYLSQSWTAILVVPVFGGVFALVRPSRAATLSAPDALLLHQHGHQHGSDLNRPPHAWVMSRELSKGRTLLAIVQIHRTFELRSAFVV